MRLKVADLRGADYLVAHTREPHMLKFFVLSLLTLSFAQAADLTVECKMIDFPYKNQFAVTTVLPMDAQTFENLEFNFTLRDAGRDSEPRFLVVNRSGSISKLPGGPGSREPFYIIVNSTDINDDLVYINLVLNYPGNFTSRLRYKDDMTYFGTCKTI